jgi:hypothetical protein
MKCKIFCRYINNHLQQIYTGYIILHKKGLIDLSVITPELNIPGRIARKIPRDNRAQNLDVIINDHIHIHYDTRDGFAFDHKALEKCDLYFKRSYLPAYIDKQASYRQKIFPLGLNYNVHPDNIDLSFINGPITSLDKYNLIRFTPRLGQMEALPNLDAEPKILFMTCTYDPFDKPDRPENEIEERISINETRASCIKLLREQFGSRFYGGFKLDEFTSKNYSRQLLKNNNKSKKNTYIETMKSYPICVATTGLHGSTGWKFAEYVACSRAILSEKLNYVVPGDFDNNRNYLEFNSPEECVEMADKLFSDRELRNEIMSNNARYYMQWLRPDNMVLNSILIALSHK